MAERDWSEAAVAMFHYERRLAERAMAQVEDDDSFRVLGDNENSIAILVKHIAGNARSRWRSFLTSDGEKPDRDRDTEFEVDDDESRKALMARWSRSWQTVFDTIEGLSEKDLGKTVHIRGEAHLVSWAVLRQVQHYAYHVGQIVQLARRFAGPTWKSLSVPRGESKTFNADMRKQTRRQF